MQTIYIFSPLQAHYRLIEALALERPEVENEDDSTLPPIDRQTKKLGDLPQLFCDAHGYVEEVKNATKRKNETSGKLQRSNSATLVLAS